MRLYPPLTGILGLSQPLPKVDNLPWGSQQRQPALRHPNESVAVLVGRKMLEKEINVVLPLLSPLLCSPVSQRQVGKVWPENLDNEG